MPSKKSAQAAALQHYKLPADISRCLDNQCPLNHQCLRWLQREINVHERSPYVQTFRDTAESQKCDHQIAPKG